MNFLLKDFRNPLEKVSYCLAITFPGNRFSAPILEMQESGPSKVAFWKFSYKRLVLCSIADTPCSEQTTEIRLGVKFLHFLKSVACSIGFRFCSTSYRAKTQCH